MNLIRTFIVACCGAVLLLFVSAGRGSAQEHRRDWTEGKLTWEDFSDGTEVRAGMKGGKRASGFKFFFGYHTEKRKEGIEKFVRPVATAYMDTRLSFADPERRTHLLLRYNQVIFDLTEWHRRSLQEALYKAGSPIEAEALFKYSYDLLEGDLRQFKEDANYGTEKDAVDFWQQRMEERLDGSEPDPLPEIEERNFGFGIHAGVAGSMFFGSLADRFRPGLGFGFGFDMAFKRVVFNVGGTLYRPSARTDLNFGPETRAGERLNFALIELLAGYTLIDGPRLKLTPSAGLGITEFSRGSSARDNGVEAIVDYNFMAGITADYKLSRSVKLISTPFSLAGGVKERAETSLRMRVFIARSDFSQGLSGTSVNVALGLSGFGRLLRIK